MKIRKKSRHTQFIGVLTFISILLILWEMSIYRKTFISMLIPIAVGVIGGFLIFLFLNTRINYYSKGNRPFWVKAFHGTFTFGGILMFSFMVLNYYGPISREKEISLKMIKTDSFGARRGRAGDPYAIVIYGNTRKQLVFSRRADIENFRSVRLKIAQGLFGFTTIKSMRLENSKVANHRDIEVQYQYDKIKLKAEEYYSEGNLDKAIELYERAIQLKPRDKQASFRLKELKTLSINS